MRLTFPHSNSLPRPNPSTPAVNDATVKLDGPPSHAERVFKRVSGMPPKPNPPTATVSPDFNPDSCNAVGASLHNFDGTVVWWCILRRATIAGKYALIVVSAAELLQPEEFQVLRGNDCDAMHLFSEVGNEAHDNDPINDMFAAPLRRI